MGMKVVVANEEQQRIPGLLKELMLKHKVDGIQTTPSRMKLFLDDEDDFAHFKNVRTVILGGEVFPQKLLEKLKEVTNARIYNGYGPTETTVYSTFRDLTDTSNIDIGRPIANTSVYIMDRNLNLVPIGIAGELYIGGEGTARGYLNRPELTKEKFVPNPFKPGELVFKTGDLARWYPNGGIQYLGRIDHQVKIRGLRIELGEIENLILKFSGVKKAVVIDKEDSLGKKYLCAYIESDVKLSVPELRASLAKQLPAFMIPSYFVQIDRIPLNLNGKINRDELPEPDASSGVSSEYSPPSNEIERKLADIWCSVLNIDRAGINDSFFELGGDSLNLVSVIVKIHKEFDVEVPLAQVYKSPTIKGLAVYIEHAQKSIFIPIEPVEELEYYPMSSAQKRLFVLMKMDNVGIAYNTPEIALLEGTLDRKQFDKAFKELLARHEALRTSFEMVNGEPVQKISKHVDFTVDYKEANEDKLEGIIEDFIKPFNLDKAPLLRVGLVKLSKHRHILLIDMHHIITDGTSIEILVKELDRLYKGEILPELKVQYKDFTAWQKKQIDSEIIKKQEEYWLNAFSNEIPLLDLPSDYPRPPVKSYEGDALSFSLGKRLTEQVKKLAFETNSTLYMVLLSVLNILLSKYSGQEDIVIGTPIAGRKHMDVENVLGMFVNTLAIRNYPKQQAGFLDFIEEVKQNALEAYENQDYPFDELVDRLKLKRDLSRNPLFDIMFVFQNFNLTDLSIGDIKVLPYQHHHHISKFDMLLEAFDDGDDIRLSLEFYTKLYKRSTIEKFVAHFIKIINIVVHNSKIRLSDIDILSEDEKHELLYNLNSTKADFSLNQTIHQLFEEQVDKTPEAIAAVYEGNCLTYRELNEKANQLARILRRKNITPDTIVGIMMERSPEMLAGVLGVLKAGGAYLPIDPDYPEERIRYMLEDSNAAVLLTDGNASDKFGFNSEIVNIKEVNLDEEDTSNLASVNKPEDLLYIIYTSGSTGKPKGVMLEHRNIVNLMNYQFNSTNINFDRRVLQFATISFDVCYQEIFSTLLSGGRLYIANNDTKKNVVKLLKFIGDNEINVVFLPPAYLKLVITDNELISKLPVSVKHIVVAGEQLIVTDQLKEYLKRNKVFLHNHYGPSESHVVTTFTVDPEGDIPMLPSIGRPISNTKIYILDKSYSLVPAGVRGELCISGDSVGRGYINRPELTSEKFIPDPYEPGRRMYKTGDLARWMPDGNLEFLGRIDHQIKIRGFRVELGEIESQLLNHEAIKEAVVVHGKNEKGNSYLCAYMVSDKEVTVSELRSFLSAKLPAYMIPSYFIRLKEMPLTPSGKIDRKALPEPGENMETDTQYVEPKTQVEELLAKIWSEVLNLDKIGINDNFFELGGDSLSIIQVQIKAFSYNWGITAQDFYKYQTVKELAAVIEGKTKNGEYAVKAFNEEIEAYYDEVAAGFDGPITCSKNAMEHLQLDNVLFTGATGFLGAHVLNEILSSASANVFCLVRGQTKEMAEERLFKTLDFYFPGKYTGQAKDKIVVINGDITLNRLGLTQEAYSELGNRIDTVIHTAALVKHYGHYEDFERVNVTGTKEIITFCTTYHSSMYHVSTIGVYSAYKPLHGKDGDIFRLTENVFYTGNNYSDNVYIKSKFEAERLVYDAIKTGLVAKILRVGNLTGRYSDGFFQANIFENAFYKRLKSIAELKAVPDYMAEQDIEFTPVDYCSKAVARIICCRQPESRIFHVYNHNKIKLGNLLEVFRSLGINVKTLDNDAFNEYINGISIDENRQKVLSGLIHDFNGDNRLEYDTPIVINSAITQEYFKNLDFEWPQIDGSYIRKLLQYARKVRFLP